MGQINLGNIEDQCARMCAIETKSFPQIAEP